MVGILNKHLPAGQRAVLVGGSLVEFYTTGAYTTGDVDLVGDRDPIGALLTAAGFERDGRYYVHDDLGLVCEVPSRSLRPTETIVDVEVEGYTVPMVSVEDAIVDRLLAAEHWRSPTDWEQAVLLYHTHKDRLNPTELRQRAEANDVAGTLADLEASESR